MAILESVIWYGFLFYVAMYVSAILILSAYYAWNMTLIMDAVARQTPMLTSWFVFGRRGANKKAISFWMVLVCTVSVTAAFIRFRFDVLLRMFSFNYRLEMSNNVAGKLEQIYGETAKTFIADNPQEWDDARTYAAGYGVDLDKEVCKDDGGSACG